MGKAKRFNSYDSDVEQRRKLVKSYGQARQSKSVTSFRSIPQSPTISGGGEVFVWGADHNAGDFDLLGLDTIAFTDIGGQIAVADATAGFNFVTTSDRPFRFTPNATNILDITDAGLSMIAGDIDLNNLNIIGVNAIHFNETGQSITDNTNGLRFVLTDVLDTFDFTTNSNLNLSIEKYFINMKNSRIQMTEEIAPSASLVSTEHRIYVDSTTKKLSILHSTGAAVSLEGGGSWISTATSDLDMSTFNIDNVDQVNFEVTGQRLNSTSSSIQYEVPSGDRHNFLVNSSSEMAIRNTGVTITNDLTVGDNSTLGTYGAGNEVNINGKLDFRENTSSVNQTASDSDGYINILVGGLAKKLYYY